VDRDGLLRLLGGLRTARIDAVRAPHKPLLLLWLFGRLAATGSSLARYAEAEEPVSGLINDFGPPARPATARQRAAMPFVHLERELWDLRDSAGAEIGPGAPERRTWLLDRHAVGRLRPEVERLLADPANLAAAARLLLDLHFTPVLAELICAEVDLCAAGGAGPGSPRRCCGRMRTSARCAGSTVRSGGPRSAWRRRTCGGTASTARTGWTTRSRCARCTTRCPGRPAWRSTSRSSTGTTGRCSRPERAERPAGYGLRATAA
jgi:hypothetical protein